MFLGIHTQTRRNILRIALDLYVKEAARATGRGATIPADLLDAANCMIREINACESLNNIPEQHPPGDVS
jgi:hypothetical protein